MYRINGVIKKKKKDTTKTAKYRPGINPIILPVNSSLLPERQRERCLKNPTLAECIRACKAEKKAFSALVMENSSVLL
jgi:hypothetical protein